MNGVRKAQWDFNRGEVIEGACSIDCSSLHLDKLHQQQRAEKRKSEESVLTASGQLLQKEGNMMVKQHMLFTLYSICGIVLKGKSASNFKAAYAVLCKLGGSSSLRIT